MEMVDKRLMLSLSVHVSFLVLSLSVRSPVPAASQQPSQSEQELAEVKGLLRTAEEQKAELAEQLKNANTSVEQYRAVVLTLEDSLQKEKEVQLFSLFFIVIQQHTLPSSVFVIHLTLLTTHIHLSTHEN